MPRDERTDAEVDKELQILDFVLKQNKEEWLYQLYMRRKAQAEALLAEYILKKQTGISLPPMETVSLTA